MQVIILNKKNDIIDEIRFYIKFGGHIIHIRRANINLLKIKYKTY